MADLLVLLAFIGVVVGVVVFLTKKGKIKDSDGDLIPDVVEKAAEAVKDVVEDAADIPAKVVKKATGRKKTSATTEKKATTAKKTTTRGRPKKGSTGGGKGSTELDTKI
jgi:septal ring-binding cell division protein DamX